MQDALRFENQTRKGIASLQFRKLQSDILAQREAAKASAEQAAYWLHKRKIEHNQVCVIKCCGAGADTVRAVPEPVHFLLKFRAGIRSRSF